MIMYQYEQCANMPINISYIFIGILAHLAKHLNGTFAHWL